MFIHEAVQKTSLERPMITRKAWIYPTSEPGPGIVIMPTDSPNGCMIVRSEPFAQGHTLWTPKKEDLLADAGIPSGSLSAAQISAYSAICSFSLQP